jgi:RHS repeat-associated protein
MPSGATAQNLGLTFAYTAASQLQSRTSNNAIYEWPGYGTGTTNATADGLNRDSAIAALTDGYDRNGNITDDGARTFAYDFDNRLASVAIASSSTQATLSYDPVSRLRQQQTTIGAGSPVVTQYLYDGQRLAAEYDGSGTLLRRYVHGPGTDQPVVWYEGAGTSDRRWLHADERGSVVAYSKVSGPAVIGSFGPYGEPAAWGGSRFAYTGQIQLAEVQLFHYKGRVYDPVAGRFLQADPIGYDGGANLYKYVGSDPINKFDTAGTTASLTLAAYNGGSNVNQLNIGNEAHQILQNYAVHTDSSYFAEAYSPPVPQSGNFGGRVDLGENLSNQVYEIKPNNPVGIAQGALQAEYYSTVQNLTSSNPADHYHPAESPPSFFRGNTLQLPGSVATYTYTFQYLHLPIPTPSNT